LLIWAWRGGVCADKSLTHLFDSISRIHRRLDKVTSIMAFLDVRFNRNEEGV
jgi:hypothetical protein